MSAGLAIAAVRQGRPATADRDHRQLRRADWARAEAVADVIVAGDAARILNGAELDQPLDLELGHVLESDGYLFLRYRRPL